MTSNARAGSRILGSLRSADGKGVVRIEDRYDTDIDDLWSALTDPAPSGPLARRGRGRPPPGRGVPRVRFEAAGMERYRAGGGVRASAAAAGGDQGNRRVLQQGEGVPSTRPSRPR